jgi:hypothetical protein
MDFARTKQACGGVRGVGHPLSVIPKILERSLR